MKNIVFLWAPILFTACAARAPQPTQPPTVVPASADMTSLSAPKTIVLNSHDRMPAGVPNLQWVPTDLVVKIDPATSHLTYDVTVNQEMSWTESETYQDVCPTYQDVAVQTDCQNVQCQGDGAGKSEAWNRYYSVPQDQKSQALADAIKGVGRVSADALVTAGYFHQKPRSWDDFVGELNRAAAAGVIRKSVVTDVTNSAVENAANLGYGPSACVITTRSCSAYVQQLVNSPCTKARDVTKKKIEDSRKITVDVQVQGAKLLANESDSLRFRIDQFGKLVDMDANGQYNHYNATSNSAANGHLALNVVGAGRILQTLPSRAVSADSFTMVGTQPTFVINVDPSFIPGKEDPNSQLVVDYTVRDCEYGWTGTCGFSAWKDLKMGSFVITAARTIVPIDLPKKHKGELLYTITRRGSQFYSNQATQGRETDVVKMPKM